MDAPPCPCLAGNGDASCPKSRAVDVPYYGFGCARPHFLCASTSVHFSGNVMSALSTNSRYQSIALYISWVQTFKQLPQAYEIQQSFWNLLGN